VNADLDRTTVPKVLLPTPPSAERARALVKRLSASTVDHSLLGEPVAEPVATWLRPMGPSS
jgi:hypothetical protein